MGIGSPSRHLKGSIATIGEGAYGFGLNIVGNVYGVITNGFGNKPDGSDVRWFLWVQRSDSEFSTLRMIELMVWMT